ncbi:DNA gyrase inhibitor GyrI [Pontibacter ummariensis]|uniref:DNA gyrase inhibitor GyrI n=1 Tax=Pontibacter ummariensis TaxID=1610492 RepID=A0A239GTB8_9BACT|nr:GyrI-like domain-containing protein [Pontibacter ummariensis]PRY11034.1 DNA gyrase inhibitor GyrI [Pontibacter ummariensis]SNS72367.1 DNA gyrase inhibitor GyrI [Pontibacter ummariensis]
MKKFFYVMAGVAILILVLYTYLGGFTAPDVTVVELETKYVAGVPFEGSVEDEALGRAFQRAAKVVEQKELEGVLGSVYYNNPDTSGDSLRAFIGVIVPDPNVTLPEGYELRTVQGGKKVVHVEANANIALLPGKLYEAAFDYADTENLKLEDFYVEWFPEEDIGVLEVPIKQ